MLYPELVIKSPISVVYHLAAVWLHVSFLQDSYTHQWHILIWMSHLAEGYNNTLCTFLLHLVSGSGFATYTHIHILYITCIQNLLQEKKEYKLLIHKNAKYTEPVQYKECDKEQTSNYRHYIQLAIRLWVIFKHYKSINRIKGGCIHASGL